MTVRRPRPDDTVLVKPPGPLPPPPRRWPVAAAASLVALLLLAGGGWWWSRPAALPEPAPAATPRQTEAAIRDADRGARTVLRLAANPAIAVIDFPTLREQGQMLNRLAAWAEKAGVPHDRLLSDAELDAAIQASGATPDTYYLGHDYSAKTVDRFFDLAAHDHVALRAEEETLRRTAAALTAELGGYGALITVPRAGTANDVSASSRAVILHHELSHGEYFTNPAYAAFVQTFWDSLLSGDERAAFRTYLTTEGYDPTLTDVIVNEMQAYLMFTPNREFFDPARLGIPPARLAQIQAAFLAGMPPGWLRDAATTPLPRRRRTARRRPVQRSGRVSRTAAATATMPPPWRRRSIAAVSSAT